MRLTSLFPIAFLATTVLASGASIVAAISKISNDTTALNSSVTKFSASKGNPLLLLPIVIQSASLLSDINSGTKVASSSANLTLAEVISVAGATTGLVSSVQSVLANIVATKSLFDRELVSPVIYLNLVQEKSATDKFSAAVISKVPADLQGLAASIVAPADTAFTAAISDYKGAI
jgi:hypothetical protein